MKPKLSLAFGLVLLSTAAFAGSPQPTQTKFHVVPLVSDQPGVAAFTDPNLVNPWGMAQAPGNPLWVSDNHTNLSTVYDPATGQPQALVVNIPSDGPTGAGFVPPGTGFPITENGNTGDSIFTFDTEGGAILGWNPDVDPNNAVIAVDNSAKDSVYKGLAYDPADVLLFAADFHNNQVQVYDSNWNLVRSFTDTGLPKNFAPFNVAWINNKLYVAFAERQADGDDEVDGKGLGYIDVFDAQGVLLKHLIANGKLNGPWGMLIAPPGYGKFAGQLLVGNFGNGYINVYDPNKGTFKGHLRADRGKPIVIDGLWSLFPGPNDNTVTFSAGPDDESHGLLGQIVR
jgi:uncharacterized protein (TIGR03118 family)